MFAIFGPFTSFRRLPPPFSCPSRAGSVSLERNTVTHTHTHTTPFPPSPHPPITFFARCLYTRCVTSSFCSRAFVVFFPHVILSLRSPLSRAGRLLTLAHRHTTHRPHTPRASLSCTPCPPPRGLSCFSVSCSYTRRVCGSFPPLSTHFLHTDHPCFTYSPGATLSFVSRWWAASAPTPRPGM